MTPRYALDKVLRILHTLSEVDHKSSCAPIDQPALIRSLESILCAKIEYTHLSILGRLDSRELFQARVLIKAARKICTSNNLLPSDIRGVAFNALHEYILGKQVNTLTTNERMNNGR